MMPSMCHTQHARQQDERRQDGMAWVLGLLDTVHLKRDQRAVAQLHYMLSPLMHV